VSRERIDIAPPLERLSILDEAGELDEDLEPELPPDLLRRMLEVMIRARRFDARLLELQRSGRIGTFAPVKGQEAAQIGSVSAIEADDWMVPAFRETAASLWRGATMVDLTVFNAGYSEGVRIPDDGKDLPIAVPVASQLPHAAGLGYAAKHRETAEVVLTYFGDGATSEGDFHEALNFAAVFALPVVFVCQNNQWAISVPRERQTRSRTLAQKALAYGMPGIQVDGNDLLAVRVASDEAVARARAGEGPTLIECVTYRLSVHTTADDPTRYRDREEVQAWEERDPIPRFRQYLLDRETIDQAGVDEIEAAAAEEVAEVWELAAREIDTLGGATTMFDHLYHEVPALLQSQRERMAASDAEAVDA